ncbi:uncharacterized protein LODBEIA_P16870 [Lodderomyces beijingensis]|uniref:Protein arginine methyltransferase NDUFAF7 n=1 Tax=Lodderomyces beijingensis TaxID=1775926 RepID=A0ABP0ZH27_9ASCO
MLRRFTRQGIAPFIKLQCRTLATSSNDPPPPSSPPPPPHKDGLYFGQFTKQEYEEAARAIKQQIAKLEGEIKGDHNLRENLGKMAQFPAPSSDSASSPTEIHNLTDFFRQTIKLTGPIPLSAYMRQCLTHPEYGYYTTRNPLDLRTGDFITSPEISSVFGEMIGVWFFNIWQTSKNARPPRKIRFIEFGPGRGTLIHDVIATFNKFVAMVSQDYVPRIEVVLIEASPTLRREQWKLICGEENEFAVEDSGVNRAKSKWGNEVVWVDTEKAIPRDAGGDDDASVNYIVAHEFFDALPIKSFVREKEGWRELVVDHTPSVNNTQLKLASSPDKEKKEGEKGESESSDTLEETQFHVSISPKETPASMIPKIGKRYKDLPEGTRIEICPDAELFMMKIAQLVAGSALDNKSGGGSEGKEGEGSDEGAALVVDYGPSSGIPENTLRGIYKHKFVSPFYKPGEVDLSADVDFENLKNVSSTVCDVFGPIQQGDWLHNIGVGYRIDQLIKKNSHDEETQEKIYGAYRRLVDDEEMGKIFKFMAVLPKGSDKPVGF